VEAMANDTTTSASVKAAGFTVLRSREETGWENDRINSTALPKSDSTLE
jgi:hypothetical protein